MDGLEAWIVIFEKYGENDPIINLVFDNAVQNMGGVYEVHKDYDSNNVQVGLRWNFESYSSCPEQFPNWGHYRRSDNKPPVEFVSSITGLFGDVGLDFNKKLSVEFDIEWELFTFGCCYSNGLTWHHVDTESVNEWHPGAGFNFLGLGSEYRTDYNASSNEFSGGITNEADSPGLKDRGI